MRKLLTSMALLLTIAGVSAQDNYLDTLELDEVVVTGTKYALPVEKSGKTIYKLTKKDIEANAGKTAADLLNEIPGIQVDGNFGTPGTNLSYFVRGGGNQQTLILIDGTPLNDPSGISLSYDLRKLSVNQIESIEVLKGGLSTLYGTGASAAVINIKLKDAGDEPLKGTIDLNAGSFGTFGQNINVGGTQNGMRYFASVNNVNSEGFSAAENLDPSVTPDDDGFSQTNALVKLGYDFLENLKLDFLAGYDRFDADFDGGAFVDSDQDTQNSNQLRFGLAPSFQYGNGTVKLNALYNINEREFEGSFPTMYKGRNLQIDLTNKHEFSSLISTLIGVNLQDLSYEQLDVSEFDDSQFTIVDPYASVFIDNGSRLNVHLGARLNTHSEYGSNFIYNINPSYVITADDNSKIKLFGSISTAFVTPSLFQLFSFFGNDQLNPEEATNYEFGVSLYELDNRVTINATYFKRDEKDPIGFISEFDQEGNFIGGSYQNIASEREVDGVELDAKFQVTDEIAFTAYYAYAESDVEESFYRIPNDKFGFNLNYQLLENALVSLKYNYVGEREIFSFTSFEEVDLDSYQLFDVYANYKLLNNKLTVYGAINNAFDEEFIAIEGFTTRGRNYSVGASYSF